LHDCVLDGRYCRSRRKSPSTGPFIGKVRAFFTQNLDPERPEAVPALTGQGNRSLTPYQANKTGRGPSSNSTKPRHGGLGCRSSVSPRCDWQSECNPELIGPRVTGRDPQNEHFVASRRRRDENMTVSLHQAFCSRPQLKLRLWSCFVDDRPIDSELADLVSDAFEDDRRASLSENAAESTDADSPEHELAAHDHEVSVNSWRKVVVRNEKLRKVAHPPNQPSPLSDDALRLLASSE
jgi:hypothetical protein